MERDVKEDLAARAVVAYVAHHEARYAEHEATIERLVCEQLVDRLLVAHAQRHVCTDCKRGRFITVWGNTTHHTPHTASRGCVRGKYLSLA